MLNILLLILIKNTNIGNYSINNLYVLNQTKKRNQINDCVLIISLSNYTYYIFVKVVIALIVVVIVKPC